MTTPMVSVLLPVRNGGRWLEAGLASLTRQSLSAFEVIAVDDGSDDDSGALLDAWADRDPRFTVVHQPAEGLVAALNRGFEHSRAPLVARMDADDISHPKRLELQAARFANRPEVGVVSCLVRHFPSRSVAMGFRLYEEWLNSLVTHDEIKRERFIESPVAHPSVMVRREVLTEIGGWRDAGWAEDYDLWLRCFEAGVMFDKIDRPLFFWREHGGRLTRTDSRYSVPSFLRCKAHYLARGPLASFSKVVLWGAGQTGRRLSKYLIEEGVAIAAVVDIDARKIGGTLRGIEVIDPNDLPAHLDDDTVVLAAVASRGARKLIRSRLLELGLDEGKTFWCVA